MILSHVIEQLSCSSFYPHTTTDPIQVIETHISVVFLTGDYAYKLKKPVNFGFLDFSTREQRATFCQLEVTLNQRTAPELYLAVLPVFLSEQQLTLSAPKPHAEPVDYLIQMRQFDPKQVLSEWLTHDTLSEAQIEQLVDHIAQLHQQAQICSAEAPYGHPDNVIEPMLDNFPSLQTTFSDSEISTRLTQLEQWTHKTQQILWPLLEARKQQDHIKACHGDMHLANIALIEGQPTLFDGIEFNDQFRWIDTLSDLAFLLVDCEQHGQAHLKRQILNRYLNITGEFSEIRLIHFYQVYRAMVRAKIHGLRYQQLLDEPASDESERAAAYQSVLNYIQQAEGYAHLSQKPKLILMQGISGSGKSFYANQLLAHLDAIILSSDRERKRLYQIDPLTRVCDSEKAKLYSPQMSQQTYQKLLTEATHLLEAGCSVIVDATFLKRAHRAPFIALANQTKTPCLIVSLQINLKQVASQLAEREKLNNSPSDANFDIARQQGSILESFEASEPHCVLTNPSGWPPQPLVHFLNSH